MREMVPFDDVIMISSVVKWWEMQLLFLIPSEKLNTKRVKSQPAWAQFGPISTQ